MSKKKYSDWYRENWANYCGLISQVDASRILDVTPARINQMIKEEKLDGIQYDKKDSPKVSFVSVMSLKYEKDKRGK